MDNALIVFLKNFEKGQVKTRLARSLGDEKALEIYKYLVDHTIRQAIELNCTVFLYFSDYIDTDFIKELQSQYDLSKFEYKVQKGQSLGDRMWNAFVDTLFLYEYVMLIGTDCPYFVASEMERGFRYLYEKDVVLGPTNDGGYYAIAMKKDYNFFKNIKWSTESVLQNTIAKIIQKGLEVRMLHIYDDIDYLEDWKNFKDFSAFIDQHIAI